MSKLSAIFEKLFIFNLKFIICIPKGRQAMEWVIDKVKTEALELSAEAQKCMDNVENEAKKLTVAAEKCMDNVKKEAKDFSVKSLQCMDNVFPKSI